MLLFEIVRFSEELEPKVILVEQVKGLLSSKGSEQRRGEIFEKFLIALEMPGYSSKWRVVLAADYGVTSTARAIIRNRHAEKKRLPLSRTNIRTARRM